jgi:hypothetical protein
MGTYHTQQNMSEWRKHGEVQIESESLQSSSVHLRKIVKRTYYHAFKLIFQKVCKSIRHSFSFESVLFHKKATFYMVTTSLRKLLRA